MDGAGRVGVAVGQVEGQHPCGLVEKPPSATCDNRGDVEVQLVEEPVAQQVMGERTASVGEEQVEPFAPNQAAGLRRT